MLCTVSIKLLVLIYRASLRVGLLSVIVLFFAYLLYPVHRFAIHGFGDGNMTHTHRWAGPVPVLDSRRTTSPGRISCTTSFHFCTPPTPMVTMRVCPSGCVCQAVGAPAAKVTTPPPTRAGAVVRKRESTVTSPVKYCWEPMLEGSEPTRVTLIGSCSAA